MEGADGLVSVLGGKLTGYRAIAEELTDLICRKLGVRTGSKTAETPLSGAGAREYPDVAAQVVHAVRAEQCLRVSDFMLRRSLLGFRRDQGLEALPVVAASMAEELGWSEARKAAELEAYRKWIEETQAFRAGG
jgi:glycerol-3-phosphate dehydrogenase